MKIILIEDEKNIADPIIKVLSKQGYIVEYADNGKLAKDMLNVNTYDCIILDLNLPIIDGLEIAKNLRGKGNNTPILMLTARVQIYDKLKGFDTGADDYLTKPFDLQELIARIKSLIKRSSDNQSLTLDIGNLKFKNDQNLLISKKNDLLISKLSNKESGILEYLLRHKGKCVSAEELLEHVWDEEINTFTQTVKTHIKTLRQKLGVESDKLTTIKGKGYIIY